MMNSTERKRQIIELLKERGSIEVWELTNKFSISKVTVRNDLDDLELKGHLVRTHGGAVLAEKQELVRLISNTINERIEQKKQVCASAAKSLKAGLNVIIDSGSTTVHLARILSSRHLTVLTNSLLAAQELSGSDHIELIVSGGVLRRQSMSLIGATTRHFFEQIHADILFLGASGVSLEQGVTCTNIIEAETKQAMIRSAAKVFLLVDSSKLGKVSLAKVCGWDSVDILVTESIEPDFKKQLEENGVEVLIAE